MCYTVTNITRRTGYGQHGDYLFGWQSDALQRGMEALKTASCQNANCPTLKMQATNKARACTKAQIVKEDVGLNGCKYPTLFYSATESNLLFLGIKELPGAVQVTY